MRELQQQVDGAREAHALVVAELDVRALQWLCPCSLQILNRFLQMLVSCRTPPKKLRPVK